MPSLQDIATITGLAIGVSGFVFGLYQWRVSRKDKQPNVVSKISLGFLTSGPTLSEAMLFLEVFNKGERTVQVRSAELAWGKNHLVFPTGIEGTAKIPFDLESWKSERFWIPLAYVQKSLLRQGHKGKVNLKSRFTDAIGNEYDSKSKEFDIEVDFNK
jgi:hypothetical protein